MTIKNANDEHALLGILLWGRGIDEVAAAIQPTDFATFKHEQIYRGLLRTREAGVEVSPVTVWDHIPPDLRRGFDPTYLADLLEVAGVDPAFYAARLVEESRWRALEEVSPRISQLCRERSTPVVEAERLVSEWVEGLAARQDGKSKPVPIGDVFREVVDLAQRGVSVGVPTCWPSLDRLIGGWYPGSLVVVGARPSVGKSLFLTNIATHAAVRQGCPVYLASVEMSRFELIQRVVSDLAGVKLSKLRGEDVRLTDAEWGRVAARMSMIQEMPLWIVDASAQTVTDIRAGVRLMRRQFGRPPLVLVDYLQLLPGGEQAERRDLKVANDTRALKRLARDENTTVILAAQLNRDAANREPSLSHLRESGAIEQDADVVILLHAVDDDNDNRLSVLVEKHRNGPTGRTELVRQGWLARIASREDARSQW